MEQQFVAMDTLKKAAPTVRFASQAASRTLLPLAARGDAVRGIFVPIHQGSSPVSHDHPTMTIPPGSGEKHGIDREKTTTLQIPFDLFSRPESTPFFPSGSKLEAVARGPKRGGSVRIDRWCHGVPCGPNSRGVTSPAACHLGRGS